MNHETIAELLPWYVNGTLPPHERAAVEAELASCPLCAAELAELQRIHAAMHEIDKDAPGPSESLMSRTLARLDSAPTSKEAFSLRQWWEQLSAPGKVAALVPAALAIALVFLAVRFTFGAFGERISAVNEVKPQTTTDTYTVNQPRTMGPVTSRSSADLSRNAAMAPPAPAAAGGPAAAPAPVVGELSQTTPQLKLNMAPVPPAGQRPQLIRTGTINLIVPDVEHALAQLGALAQVQFGDVISLNDETPSQPGVRHTADVQLAVPADRFDQTMEALGKLGAVQSRTIGAENVSDQIVDARARLRNLRRTEADMLRILDRAGKIPDVLEVTQQIAQVREQIEQLDGQLQSLEHRVAYSTITIGIEDEKPVATAEPSMGTQINDAWKAAVQKVRNYTLGVVSVLLVLVAFAPYWLGVTLIALFLANRLRKR
jgi:hypothetical protein